MASSRVDEVRKDLVPRILNQDAYDDRLVQQLCISARDELVQEDIGCGEADKTVMAAVIGAVSRKQLDSIHAALLVSDPPPPAWRTECDKKILSEVTKVHQRFGLSEPSEDVLEALTTVINDNAGVIVKEAGLPRRRVMEQVSESLYQSLPRTFVDKIMLEVQMRSFGRRLASSQLSPA